MARVQGFVQTISYADGDCVKKGTSQFTIEPEPYKRDSAQADLQSAQSNAQQAEINLGYTNVTGPFDGVVTARQVSIGQFVGANSATVLSTIVQLNPI